MGGGKVYTFLGVGLVPMRFYADSLRFNLVFSEEKNMIRRRTKFFVLVDLYCQYYLYLKRLEQVAPNLTLQPFHSIFHFA